MEIFGRTAVRIVFLAAAVGAGGRGLAERPADRLVATSRGPFYGTPDGGEGELLAFDSRVEQALASLAPGERIAVDAWPVAPGVSRTMVLTRTEVYAPDARVVAIGAGGEIAVPRSTWAFFQGRDVSGTARVAVALDPDTGVMRGISISERGLHELRPPDTWTGGRHRLAAPETRDADGTPLTWECGEEQLPLMPSDVAPAPATSREALAGRTSLAAFTKYAVVAIDTDNELMGTKFSDNTATATNYIANLFNQMNLIYERDVQVHLLQGYTILRLSSVADPYSQNSGSNASGAELNEFSSYWGTHYGGVKRMVAALLSGKQPDAFSASGIAWIGGLCSTGVGYSFNKVFRFATDTSANDVFITAHEIGHNFSSPHTHCYANPKPDTCYAAELGTNCFAGTPSCPTSATYNGVTTTGTLMSYCHTLGGCAAGLVFHPLTLSRYFTNAITGASACIFNGSAAPTGPAVSGIVPSTGSTSGAMPVTINGSGFVSGATAAFIDLTGSVSLTSVAFVNSGQLTATAPAHAAGVMDVVVFNPDNSAGTLRSGFTYSAPPPPSADFNADGKTDIVWRNMATGEDAIWYMNGTSVIGGGAFGSAPLQWSIVGAGDFNGDGEPDIVWRNTTTGEDAIWYMNGASVIGGSAFGSAPLQWSIVGVGDFNGDGKPDIVWRNTTTGEDAIWYMNGTSVIGGGAFGSAPLQWSIVGVGDFNGDGKPDIVWRNTVTGDDAIWYMNGTLVIGGGAFTSAPTDWSIVGPK